MMRRAGKRIPTVVTFLDMLARPDLHVPALPAGKVAMLRAENPPVHFYRYLYNTIGEPYYWVDRRKLSDDELSEIIRDPDLHLYVLYADGCPAGMSELDYKNPSVGQLAYFGLMPEAIGRGLGHYFLVQSILNAWDRGVSKMRVNTCTLDHPRALPLYQRCGFKPYAREERYIELP